MTCLVSCIRLTCCVMVSFSHLEDVDLLEFNVFWRYLWTVQMFSDVLF